METENNYDCPVTPEEWEKYEILRKKYSNPIITKDEDGNEIEIDVNYA